jgi:large repetitive protein
MKQLLLISFFFCFHFAFAQVNDDCVNATRLCSGQAVRSNNIAGTVVCNGEDGPCTGAGKFCFGVNNTVWFKFTTNQNGGSASVNISNINSTNGDDTLQMAIISAASACDASTYTLLACRNTIDGNYTLPVSGLAPNTTYYVVIDGKGSSPPAGEAYFNILINGAAVKNIVTMTATDPTTCTSSDGSIKVVAPSGSTYSLNAGPYQGNGNFTALGPGSYHVSVIQSTGCDTSFTVKLTSPIITDADYTTTPSGCTTATGTISIINVVGGSAPYVYELNGTSQTSNTFVNLPIGTYNVKVSDASDPNCYYTVNTIIVGPDDPYTSFTTTNSDCSTSNGSLIATTVGSAAPYSYQLSPVAGVQAGNTFTALPSGTYQLTTVAANGCSSVLTAVISEKNPVTSIEVSASDVDCAGSASGSATVTSVSGGTAPYQYAIDGGSYQAGTTFSGISSGSHSIKVKDAKGCTYETEFAVNATTTITCNAGENMMVYPLTDMPMSGTASAGTPTWSPTVGLSDPNSFTPVVNLDNHTSSLQVIPYIMTVTTASGCTCSDTVIVSVVPSILPVTNTFTPNSDGLNDTWEIPRIEYYDSCVVDVFTRWGQRVFHSEGYEVGDEWDGTYLGLPVPPATYYFLINLNTKIPGFQDIYGGRVTIIR